MAVVIDLTHTTERITGVSIIHRGRAVVMPKPARHGDLIKALHERYGETIGGMQGFSTNRFPFINRTWAKKVAIAAGQIITDERKDHAELCSEDLW